VTQIDEAADAAVRLEQALDRIARLAARRDLAAAHAPGGEPDIDVAGLTERLDALIGRLRTALAAPTP
jgi:hypothetical protein